MSVACDCDGGDVDWTDEERIGVDVGVGCCGTALLSEDDHQPIVFFGITVLSTC